ncbi:MAG TPA: adenylate/guanylate cyclase domain-containing protein [Solirubrobacterales bacterium]
MAESLDSTFLFADLAGFTALTEAHGDEDAAELAAGYFESVRALLPAHRSEEIKEIGDELMLRCQHAADGVRLALTIVHEVGSRPDFPSVRVGLDTGPAIERNGDWFGSTVNRAARIAGLARGGEILLSQSTKDAAGPVPGIDFRERGRHQLKNIRDPVVLHAAVPIGQSTEAPLPIDPVCRMAVDPAQGAGTLIHEGHAYYFCSLRCAQAFASDPARYVAQAGR